MTTIEQSKDAAKVAAAAFIAQGCIVQVNARDNDRYAMLVVTCPNGYGFEVQIRDGDF